MKEMYKNLEQIGAEIVKERKKQGMSNYYAAMFCNMGSNSGLKHIEEGTGCNIITMMRVSKGLGMNFEIINGEVRVK